MGARNTEITRTRALAVLAFVVGVFTAANPGFAQTELDKWISEQHPLSIKLLLENVSPKDGAPGSVVASPQKDKPNYYFHWIRDSSLVMDVILNLYHGVTSSPRGSVLSKLLNDFVDFSRKLQVTDNPSGGLGEPKFMPDGGIFTGAWGRPQNDGPALRAVTLMRLARIWMAQGKTAQVRKKLYGGEVPATTVVKTDLDYVAQHWRDTSFDVWEEIRGAHFYNRMVQRRALLEGAQLAAELGDSTSATNYRTEANALSGQLARHWDAARGYILATLDRDGGIDYKTSNLDAAVILGVLHGHVRDTTFSYSDDRVLATARELEKTFADLYPINRGKSPAVAIGRYPEDRYDGFNTMAEGNPWFLLTAGFAELYYQAAHELDARGKIVMTRANLKFFEALKVGRTHDGLVIERRTNPNEFKRYIHAMRAKGDAFLAWVRRYGKSGGHFSEQFNRSSGSMQGARDLTWSYAALFTAVRARGR